MGDWEIAKSPSFAINSERVLRINVTILNRWNLVVLSPSHYSSPLIAFNVILNDKNKTNEIHCLTWMDPTLSLSHLPFQFISMIEFPITYLFYPNSNADDTGQSSRSCCGRGFGFGCSHFTLSSSSFSVGDLPVCDFRFSVEKSDSIVPGFMQAIFYRTETNGNQNGADFWNRFCSIRGCE